MKEFWPFTVPEDKPGLFPISLNYKIIFEDSEEDEA